MGCLFTRDKGKLTFEILYYGLFVYTG